MRTELTFEAKKRIEAFERSLKDTGLVIMTDKEKRLEMEAKGVKREDIDRMINAQHQLTFWRIFVGGYILKIHTSYDPTEERFTETGKVWSLIAVPDGRETERGKDTPVYTSVIYRVGDFLVRAAFEARALVKVMENRPMDKSGVWMDLVEIEEETESGEKEKKRNFYWVSKTDPDERISIWHWVDDCQEEDLLNYLDQRYYQVRYYEDVARKKRGVKGRTRDIRIPYTISNVSSQPVPIL
jgi:hypothetical protein